MDENAKILVGMATKIFYTPDVLKNFKKSVASNKTSPTESIASMISMIVRKAIEQAQQAGAQVTNRAVMQAITVLVKEAVELIAATGKFPQEQAPTMAKALVGATAKALAMNNPKAMMQGGQPPAQPQMGQPQMAQPGMTQAMPQPEGAM